MTLVAISPRLSQREEQVVALIGRGLTDAEIGGVLNLAQDTVKSHVRRILAKLGARNRAHAVALHGASSDDLATSLLHHAREAAERHEARTGEPWELRWLETRAS